MNARSADMTDEIVLRESVAGDIAALERIYRDAFPDEDLLPLLSQLLDDPSLGLSLVALSEGAVAGHAYFTNCTVAGGRGKLALLGPVAVVPALQGRGIGGALVRKGLDRMKKAGIVRLCVLGDPAYYGRFGFAPETEIMPPYPLPDAWHDAWQSIGLRDGETRRRGALSVPTPWRNPALWSD